MYSVAAIIDQLNWQSLEHHRDTFHLCLLSKILHHQVHIPTCDIPAPITAARSSHEKNLSVPYMQEQMCTNIHSSHIQFHYGINYQKYRITGNSHKRKHSQFEIIKLAS